jgi:hypothetical protein
MRTPFPVIVANISAKAGRCGQANKNPAESGLLGAGMVLFVSMLRWHARFIH